LPAYGATQAGFVVKPLASILADLQQAVWDAIDPNLDLSPQTPDGQMLGIIANALAAQWELAQIAYNQYNREDAEGASLDNIGDLTGTPRETATYSVVSCTCVFGGTSSTPFAAGALVANVKGQPGQQYANLYPVIPSSTTLTGVLFESATIGEVPAVNDGTLDTITTPVSSPVTWVSINNPGPASQVAVGTNEELDAAYMLRQVEELAAEGTCNPSATASALLKLAADQAPPIQLSVQVIENTTDSATMVQGVQLPPHTYMVILYENDQLGWLNGPQGGPLVGAAIYNNKPAGITSFGTVPQTITDPVLGTIVVYWTAPTQLPLYVSATVVPAPTYKGSFTTLQAAVQAALIAASQQQTPANGFPAPGQLVPGSAVVGSQLEAVIMGVPGVFDVQALTFGFGSSPTNTAPLVLTAAQIATLAAGNIIVTQGSYP